MAIKMFAAIDVGSYELELAIYEISPKKGFRQVERLRHAMAIGKDTYNDGKISYELVEEMCLVFQDFANTMNAYQVEDYRAFASSAVREAKNSQIVLDQIRVRTGIVIKAVSNSELRFMHYKALAAKDLEFHKVVQKGTAIADVGFGSLQISLFDKDTLVSTQNISLGSLRITEMLSHFQIDEKAAPALIGEMVDNEIVTFKKMYLKDRDIKTVIAVGECILYMARRLFDMPGADRVSTQDFMNFCKKILAMTLSELEEYFDIDTEYATIMIPSVIIYQKVLTMTGADTVWIPGVRLCDGITAAYSQDKNLVKSKHNFVEDILSETRNTAKRYKCNTSHANVMEKTVLQIFDSIKKYHGLGERERLLLQISAILHSCGKFVSFLHSTDSSYRIIMSTEIIGLSHLEREIIANVVRYNIKNFEYNDVVIESDLSKYDTGYDTKNDVTILIAKLTAILRLANSMDRSHKQKLAGCKMAVKDELLVITTDYPEDITLERHAFAHKVDFFEEIFGIRPVLKQKRGL